MSFKSFYQARFLFLLSVLTTAPNFCTVNDHQTRDFRNGCTRAPTIAGNLDSVFPQAMSIQAPPQNCRRASLQSWNVAPHRFRDCARNPCAPMKFTYGCLDIWPRLPDFKTTTIFRKMRFDLLEKNLIGILCSATSKTRKSLLGTLCT